MTTTESKKAKTSKPSTPAPESTPDNTDNQDITDTSDTPSAAPESISTSATENRPSDQQIAMSIEAALMISDRPLPIARLAELLEAVTPKDIKQAIDSLNKTYETTARSFRIEEVAGGYQILTLPQYSQVLSKITRTRDQTRLSPAAMEALAIIAYKQPVLRADIEAIRGVASGEIIRSLMERHLVKIVGRAEEIGRPMLYGTTKSFLETFGLASLKDLPKAEELKITS